MKVKGSVWEHTRILLPKDLGQVDGMLDAIPPRLGLKRKLGLPAFGDRRQLEEVAGDDELDATERHGRFLAQGASDAGQLVKEVAVNHGHFIDDEDLGALPPTEGFAILANLVAKSFDGLIAETKARKGVYGGTADVARCHAGRSRDGDRIGTILFLQAANDFAQQNRLARSLHPRR